MEDYSEIILSLMKSIKEELDKVDSRSLDRQRLYGRTYNAVVSNVKMLAEMVPEERQRKARDQLAIEIQRIRQKR